MTTKGSRAECPECGARLRRGQPVGAVCDPCLRKGPRFALPPGFYDAQPVAAALAVYDFGTVFLAIRAEQRWSQERLGEFVGIDQARISEIERGVRQLRDVRLVAKLAAKCAIPAVKLGFSAVTVGGGANGKGSWVERRDFIQRVAGMTLGFGTAGIDLDRLNALLPQADPTGTRHVGVSDVEAIEQATAAFRKLDSVHGGGVPRAAAIAQLQSTLPLLGAESTPDVRSRLLVAVGNLAMQAGWMSHDVQDHDAARRLWLIGLELARETDDPRGPDLIVCMLMDMTAQALALGRPDEAKRLVQLGHATVADGAHPVAASTHSFLAHNQARTHAAQGDVAACERALGQVVERFGVADPDTAAPWAAAIDPSALEGWQGWARYELAAVTRDPRIASQAVPLLRHVISHFPASHARTRALNMTELTGAHALAGDADTAVSVGHQAIDAGMGLSSQRIRIGLRALHGVLEPMHTSAGVAELRERLAATAA